MEQSPESGASSRIQELVCGVQSALVKDKNALVAGLTELLGLLQENHAEIE